MNRACSVTVENTIWCYASPLPNGYISTTATRACGWPSRRSSISSGPAASWSSSCRTGRATSERRRWPSRSTRIIRASTFRHRTLPITCWVRRLALVIITRSVWRSTWARDSNDQFIFSWRVISRQRRLKSGLTCTSHRQLLIRDARWCTHSRWWWTNMRLCHRGWVRCHHHFPTVDPVTRRLTELHTTIRSSLIICRVTTSCRAVNSLLCRRARTRHHRARRQQAQVSEASRKINIHHQPHDIISTT